MMGSTARRSQRLDGSTNDRLNLAIGYPQRGRSEASTESPHIVLGAQAPCINLAAACFDRAYGYARSVGGIAIVLPCPNVVLVAQAVLDRLGIASFDVASPHYPRFDGRIPVAAACSLVVLGAQTFRDGLGVASIDITRGQSCPWSVGGIAILAVRPLIVFIAHTLAESCGVTPFDTAPV
jgi:hypothetical protein